MRIDDPTDLSSRAAAAYWEPVVRAVALDLGDRFADLYEEHCFSVPQGLVVAAAFAASIASALNDADPDGAFGADREKFRSAFLALIATAFDRLGKGVGR